MRDIVRMREKYKTSLTKARIYQIVSRIRTRSAFDQTNAERSSAGSQRAVLFETFQKFGDNIYILDNTGGNLV